MKDEQNKEEDNQAGTNNNVEVGEESDGTDWEPLECNGCGAGEVTRFETHQAAGDADHDFCHSRYHLE